MALPAQDLDELRSAFPAWSIFRSDGGAYYGSRRAVRLSARQIDAGFQQTVSADDVESFVTQLQAQDELGMKS
ncbi:hypothetical protein AB0K18_18550 [Nonomuraea sp. NPDC049421]|uniref:hypothetical protein n=1 Tax=Nonomuraea sp. NPDC049421 TaxID=3155275 RepID=UPI00341F1703